MEQNTQETELSLAEQFRNRVVLKVAKIIKVEQHPNGEFLFILTLEVGDEEPRQIVSSIVPFYKAEELLAAADPTVTDRETCEVLFAPQFEPGTQLEPEGLEPLEEKLCYVKPDKFFSFPLTTQDGFVMVDGKKIGADGKYLTAEVYKNGTVG